MQDVQIVVWRLGKNSSLVSYVQDITMTTVLINVHENYAVCLSHLLQQQLFVGLPIHEFS